MRPQRIGRDGYRHRVPQAAQRHFIERPFTIPAAIPPKTMTAAARIPRPAAAAPTPASATAASTHIALDQSATGSSARHFGQRGLDVRLDSNTAGS